MRPPVSQAAMFLQALPPTPTLRKGNTLSTESETHHSSWHYAGRDKVGILGLWVAANASANSKRMLLKMRFRKRFAKKPGQNALRRQFCSDNRSLLVELCPSAPPCSSPGLSALRAGFGAQSERTSGESFSARRWQGDPPKGHPSLRASPPRSNPPRRACAGCEPGPSSSTHSPPWTASCTQLTTYLGVQSAGCKGYTERRTGVEGAAMPSPTENSCRLVQR